MIALQITSMKNFMNHLLVADTFDPFLLEEATVSTALTVTIDGHINRDFYPAEERGEDCIPWDLHSWSKIKGLCFDPGRSFRHPGAGSEYPLRWGKDRSYHRMRLSGLHPG